MTIGKVANVSQIQAGTELAQDQIFGDTLIFVNDVSDFDESGGSVRINSTIYGYTSKDDDLNSLTIPLGISEALTVDTPVLVDPASYEKIATVTLEDGTDGKLALIPHSLQDRLDTGIRELWEQETVILDDEQTELTIVDVVGVDPKVNAHNIVNLPEVVPAAPDGRPPGSVTTVVPVPAVRNIFLKWGPVLLNDQGNIQGQVVTYKVYASTTAGVVTDDAHLVGSTAGTMVSVGHLADGTPLTQFQSDGVTRQDYYFKVVATDDDAAGNPSPEISAQLDQNGTDDIAVGAITAEMLQSILILGTTITTRAQDPSDPSGQTLIGPGITLTPTSLIAYDTTGRKTLEITPNQTPAAVFRGDAEIDHLTVLTLTTLQESLLSQGAVMTLQSAVADPANPPTATIEWAKVGWTDDGQWGNRHGWAVVNAGTHAWTCRFTSNQWYLERWNLSTKARELNYNFTNSVNDKCVAAYATTTDDVYLLTHLSGDPAGEWSVEQHWGDGTMHYLFMIGTGPVGAVDMSTTTDPAMCIDQNNNYQYCWVDASTRQIKFQQGSFDSANSRIAAVGSVITSTVTLPSVGDLASLYACHDGNDFGSSARWVVMTRNGTASGFTTAHVFNNSGVEQTAQSWPKYPQHVNGFWYNWTLGQFEAMCYGTRVTYEGQGNYWYSGEPDNWHITYNWINGGSSSKVANPLSVVPMKKRARLKITTPALPAGVAGADLYIARATSAPSTGAANYKRQNSFVVTDPNQPVYTLNNAGFTAGDNPLTSTFGGSGTPAMIVSEATDSEGELVRLEGDGSGRVGPLSWNNTGRVDGIAIKSATQNVTNSVTFVDVTDLGLPVKAGVTYKITGMIWWNAGTSNAGDAQLRFTHPGGQLNYALVGANNGIVSGTSYDGEWIARSGNTSPSSATPIGTGGSIMYTEIIGVYTPTADGTLQLQMAQNVANAAATGMGANSILQIERLT